MKPEVKSLSREYDEGEEKELRPFLRHALVKLPIALNCLGHMCVQQRRKTTDRLVIMRSILQHTVFRECGEIAISFKDC